MKKALETGKELPPNMIAFSPKNIIKLQKFLPSFENSIKLQKLTLASNNNKSSDYNEIVKKARLYLTHFLRVINMAIFRGDLPKEIRAFYGLATNESSIPSLVNEKELLSWGKRIIEGEEFRIRKGGSPITNPTIAVVKVRYGNFVEALNHHHNIIKKGLDYAERTNDMRKEADNIILELWNEIEAYHKTLPEERKKNECEKYGLVYVYRKKELARANNAEVY